MPRFIGDVHGHFAQYEHIIKLYPDTIQVGDMGVGFFYPSGIPSTNPPHYKMVQMNARFIRGNHDNPHVCKNQSQWIADGTIEGDMMFIGGAYSIDKDWRTEGCDWWPDEELSHDEMYKIMDIYERNKPRIMVTHDCPESHMVKNLISHHYLIQTRTGQFLDSLLAIHRPEIWVHGHHHISYDQVHEGTRFVCLAELEHRVIE